MLFLSCGVVRYERYVGAQVVSTVLARLLRSGPLAGSSASPPALPCRLARPGRRLPPPIVPLCASSLRSSHPLCLVLGSYRSCRAGPHPPRRCAPAPAIGGPCLGSPLGPFAVAPRTSPLRATGRRRTPFDRRAGFSRRPVGAPPAPFAWFFLFYRTVCCVPPSARSRPLPPAGLCRRAVSLCWPTLELAVLLASTRPRSSSTAGPSHRCRPLAAYPHSGPLRLPRPFRLVLPLPLAAPSVARGHLALRAAIFPPCCVVPPTSARLLSCAGAPPAWMGRPPVCAGSPFLPPPRASPVGPPHAACLHYAQASPAPRARSALARRRCPRMPGSARRSGSSRWLLLTHVAWYRCPHSALFLLADRPPGWPSVFPGSPVSPSPRPRPPATTRFFFVTGACLTMRPPRRHPLAAARVDLPRAPFPRWRGPVFLASRQPPVRITVAAVPALSRPVLLLGTALGLLLAEI